MSSVKIEGNASGTGIFTIASPNSNTNRTLTLPDVTGTFNTSGGVNEVPAGSASAPAIYPTGDTNTGIFFPAADTIAFTEGGAECARFNSDAQLVSAAGTASLPVLTTTGDLNTGVFYPAADTVAWTTGGSERARIDSSGNLLVATTTNTSTLGCAIRNNFDGSTIISLGKNNGAGSDLYIDFNFGGAQRGYINWNGSNLLYTNLSDYRLKENIAPMTGALATVAQLNPVTYTWKDNGIAGQGFIAHELQAIVPDCVSGEKDEVDADGNPKYQGVDTSFLVATLTAAIQELKAELDATKAEVAALKGQA